MKGVVKTAPGEGNVAYQDVSEPGAPAAGHVVIAVQAAGICGTDIHIYHDEFKSWPPVVLGHELAGRVAAVGGGVPGIAVGDRVTSETYFSTCGDCKFCREGRVNLCPLRRSIGSAVNGAFTSMLDVPARNLHAIPESLSFREAALTEPLACVVHGMLDTPKICPGDLVTVAGPGAIGLLSLQVAVAAGARVVVLGTQADAHRLELARTLGAEGTLMVDRDDTGAYVRERSEGLGADVVIECSGAGAAARDLLALVRRGGQYIQIGLFGKPVSWNMDEICFKELSVNGSNASVPAAWPRALELLTLGRVKAEPLISGVYSLADWREAFAVVERRTALKILLEPTA